MRTAPLCTAPRAHRAPCAPRHVRTAPLAHRAPCAAADHGTVAPRSVAPSFIASPCRPTRLTRRSCTASHVRQVMQHGVAWLGLVTGSKLWHVANPKLPRPTDRNCDDGGKIDWKLARAEGVSHW